MRDVNYEKPSMKFVNLRNEERIAGNDGPCMAQASQGHTTFYYDAPGDGWVVIMSSADCSGKKVSYSYYDNPEIEGTVSEEAQKAAIAEATAALNKDKQAFTGAYLDPQPTWS